MIIGVPREIKPNEFRVAITPAGVESLTARGHGLLIEGGAGLAAGFADADYRAAGAETVADGAALYRRSDMVVKVKEIFPDEFDRLREGLILFTYIHSAGNPAQTAALLAKKVVAIAYEDIVTADGRAPLLTPMSEIAGEVGLILGAYHLFTTAGGGGILLGGAVGVPPARVAVLGAGSVGLGAARCALGLGADVTVLDIDPERLRAVRAGRLPGAGTLHLDRSGIRSLLPGLDLLVNAVKWPPGTAGHIVTRDMLALMKKTGLIVDIACDPAGAVETCRITTHDDPVYEVDGIRHICVDNLPSAVARTASVALANASLPYVVEIADKGWLQAVKDNPDLRRGLGFAFGHLTFRPTALVQNRPYTPAETVIARLETG